MMYRFVFKLILESIAVSLAGKVRIADGFARVYIPKIDQVDNKSTEYS